MPKGTRLDAHTGSTSTSDATRIATIMGELARCLDSSKTGLKLLGDLGELIGCPEDQFLTESMGPDFPGISEASPDLKEAQNPIPPVTPVKQKGNRRRGHSPTTPGSQSSTGSSTASLVWSTPARSGSPVSNFSTPDTSTPARRAFPVKISFASPLGKGDVRVRNDSPSPAPVPKRSLTWPKVHTELLDDSSVSSRTRARPRADLDHLAEPPLFEKLSTTFTHPQATAEIRKIIEKQLGERETESGIVYVYRRPDCELLKIGFTGGATTKPRMDSIKKACRYDRI